MSLIFITNDVIGAPTGGGRVTQEERKALMTMGFVHTFHPRRDLDDPFLQDEDVEAQLKGGLLNDIGGAPDLTPKLAHVYAGCFTRSCEYLKQQEYKITYTVAAHDVNRSRKAHEELGLPFPYPHLNDPHLFEKYTRGYVVHADLVIVPGTPCVATVRSQGRQGPISVIPHGCDLPEKISVPDVLRKHKTYGYLGAYGPDKGILTLSRAWQEHVSRPGNEGDRLFLAGSQSKDALSLFRSTPATVMALGKVGDLKDFFSLIDVYVQPSATEGFGIPVLEALAHGRPALVSDQAGAQDLVPSAFRFRAGDHKQLAQKMCLAGEGVRHAVLRGAEYFLGWKEEAKRWTWDNVHKLYLEAWKQVLEEGK